MTDEDQHVTTNEARAGRPARTARVALIVSLLLIVAIFGVLFTAW